MSNDFFPETLPARTAKILGVIVQSKASFLTHFYLSGGTALSLQLGHRESEDLDFFCERTFDPRLVQAELEKLGKIEDLELAKNTLNGYLGGVKVQFLGYPYPLLERSVDYRGIRLSSIVDIACTKLQTIGMRGSKKDFVDMYVILKKYTLPELLQMMKEKYRETEFNIPHILKSLVYFTDAEDQVMPRLRAEIEWEQVTKKMVEVVKTFKFT